MTVATRKRQLVAQRLTWDVVDEHSRELAKKIIRHVAQSNDPHSFAKAVAVGVRSIIPTAIVANELGIKYMEVLHTSQYANARPFLWNKLDCVDKYSLFVTATTALDGILAAVREVYPTPLYATLYVQRGAQEFVDVHGSVADCSYIFFPWEQDQERA